MVNRYHTFARTTSALLTALIFLNNAMYAPDVSAQTSSARRTQTRTRRATTKRVPSATQPTARQKTTQTSQPVQQQQRTIILPPPPPPPRPKPTPTPAPVVEETSADDDEIINVVSKLVVVPVSVTDARGEPVRGLTVADFRIEERGRKQEVAAIGDPEEVPLDIALLVDISGSVNERFSFEREAAGRFLRQVLRAADRATIFTIGTEVKRIGERAATDTALQNLKLVEPTRGMTLFFDTVAEAASYLARTAPPRARRVIVCISDGDDRYSDRFKTSAATITELQRAEVTFYAVNPGGNSLRLNVSAVRGQEELGRLSKATGGAVFVPQVVEDFDGIFRQIAAELRSQYLLQYYSNNEATPGQFLPITVNTPKRQELRVRARQGYFSGSPGGGGSSEPTNKK